MAQLPQTLWRDTKAPFWPLFGCLNSWAKAKVFCAILHYCLRLVVFCGRVEIVVYGFFETRQNIPAFAGFYVELSVIEPLAVVQNKLYVVQYYRIA